MAGGGELGGALEDAGCAQVGMGEDRGVRLTQAPTLSAAGRQGYSSKRYKTRRCRQAYVHEMCSNSF